MKRIFSSENSAELGSLQNMLGAAGIKCIIRENPDPAVPSFLKLELWVGHDADYANARGLCTRWRHPSPDRPSHWTCSACGAGSEDRFNACWKCGTERVTFGAGHAEIRLSHKLKRVIVTSATVSRRHARSGGPGPP
jgi:hypothetical protein